jgi:uncharacterized protein DUF3987
LKDRSHDRVPFAARDTAAARHRLPADAQKKFTTKCPSCGGGYLNVEEKDDAVVWYCNQCLQGGGEPYEQSERKRKGNGKGNGKSENGLGDPKSVYDYVDENGNRLFQALRFEPVNAAKQFRQRTGPDQEKWSIKDVRIVPFRLPELIEDIAAGHVIFIVEGEKDVNTLRSQGVPATCNPMGAGKWWPEFNEILRGADIVICGDNDEPGRGHVALVAKNLHGIAKRLRVLDLKQFWPQIEESDDVSDWFTRGGGTVERLWKIVEQLKDRQPTKTDGNSTPKPKQSQFEDDPVDLWNSFEPPPLPRHLLPKEIESYAFTMSETMGVDPAWIAMSALTVCAAAIHDSIKLRMKKHSADWHESARIWCGGVGSPATMKSPAMAATAKPLRKLDAELLRQYQYAKNIYKKLSAEERKGVEQPVQRRLCLEDVTIESAQEVLSGSPGGVLLYQDELSGWLGGMDKYSGRGANKDRGFWLQSWNGGPATWNRIGRGEGIIPNLSACLLGGVQPDVIRKFAMDSYDDGFLQRMLLIMLRPAVIGQDVPKPAVADRYDNLIKRLTELSAPWENFSRKPMALRFDAEAQQVRNELEHRHLELMQLEAINKKLASHIGKYNGYFGRLCVLWHCIEHAYEEKMPPPVVTGDTAKRVAEFMQRFLLPHALAFYSGVLGLADDHDRLAAVAGYILAHKLERITNRDIQRGDGTMRKLTDRDTEQVFEQLDALGWVVRAIGARAPCWVVNPVVHMLFADRATKEEERRARARELILKKVKSERAA